MTKAERTRPELLAKGASRRRRVARGSGRSEAQVSELLSTFTQMRVQMKTMSKMMAQAGGMGATLSRAILLQTFTEGCYGAGQRPFLGPVVVGRAQVERAQVVCAQQEPFKLSQVRSPLSNCTGYSALSSYRNSWDNAFPSPGSASPPLLMAPSPSHGV
jgi:hypothetical protein